MVNPSTTTTVTKSSSSSSRAPPANNTKSNQNNNHNNKSANAKTKKRTSQTTVTAPTPLSYRNAENKSESVRLLTATPVTDRNLNRSGNNSSNVNNSAVSCDGGNDIDKRSFTKSNNKFKRSISHNISNRNVGGNCGKWRSSSTSDASLLGKSNIKFVPIEAPSKPILSSTSIAGVLSDQDSIILLEKYGKGRYTYPLMQVSCFLFVFELLSFVT